MVPAAMSFMAPFSLAQDPVQIHALPVAVQAFQCLWSETVFLLLFVSQDIDLV